MKFVKVSEIINVIYLNKKLILIFSILNYKDFNFKLNKKGYLFKYK